MAACTSRVGSVHGAPWRYACSDDAECRTQDQDRDAMLLLGHENVAKFALDPIGGIVEAKVDGACDLSEIIEGMGGGSGGAISERYAIAILKQVLDGLSWLHDGVQISHGCIAPENVLIDGTTGTVQLSHRNHPRLEDSEDDGGFSDVGATPYSAPEVVRSDDITPASDVWSLGCLLIHILSGEAPWASEPSKDGVSAVLRVAHGDHPPIPKGISMSAFAFISSCLTPIPDHRPTVGELLLHPLLEVRGQGACDAFDDTPLLATWPVAGRTRPCGVPQLSSVLGRISFGAKGKRSLRQSARGAEGPKRLCCEPGDKWCEGEGEDDNEDEELC